MRISSQWDNDEKTVIYQHYEPAWTWDDYDASSEQVIQMLNSVSHKVDLIIDTSATGGKVPPNAITHWRNTFKKRPANIGATVIVAVNPFVQALANIMITVTGSKMILVSTAEKARALVYKKSLVRE